MPDSLDDLDLLDGRPGWTVAGAVATFQLAAGGWRATVRRVPGTRAKGYSRYDRWHVALHDPAGRCTYSRPVNYLPEAWRTAEGLVRAAE